MSLAEIDHWSTTTIRAAARAALQRAHGTRGASLGIGDAVAPLDWRGNTAMAVKCAVERTVADLNAHADACEAVAHAAEKAADGIDSIKLRLQQIRALADDHRLRIDDDTGAVHPPANLSSFSSADQRAIADAQARLSPEISSVLAGAWAVDADLADAIRAADGSPTTGGDRTEIGGRSPTVPTPPPLQATPEQVNTWWGSLSPADQEAVKRALPDSIRNRDGIPADVRSELNMSALRREIIRLRNGWLDHDGWHTDRAKLDDLTELRDVLAHQYNTGLRILLLDTESNHHKVLAAVAVGDVDNADRVGVTVGGMNTRVSSSVRKMVGEAVAQRDKASQLREVAGLPNADAIASVAYLGYDAPSNPYDVARDDRARAGAGPLNNFYRGLAASTNIADQHITAFGHSYGSLTTSLALQRGAPVDAVVLYGSPGAEITNAAELGVGPGHAYYMIASHDRIADTIPRVHPFGPGLFDVPGMIELSVDRGVAPDGVLHERASGHSDYTRLGGNGELRMSGYNMAAVLAGLPDKVIRPRALAPGPFFNRPGPFRLPRVVQYQTVPGG